MTCFSIPDLTLNTSNICNNAQMTDPAWTPDKLAQFLLWKPRCKIFRVPIDL
jgi:hypothetical protein